MGAQPSDLRVTVLRLIADAAEPIKSEDIRAHESLKHEEGKQIANLLFRMKASGDIVVDDERRYSLSARGRTILAGEGNGPAIAPARGKQSARAATPPREKKRDLSTHGVIGSMLQKLVDESQNALDTYLRSVGDPAIYEPLKLARDQANEALTHYQSTTRK